MSDVCHIAFLLCLSWLATLDAMRGVLPNAPVALLGTIGLVWSSAVVGSPLHSVVGAMLGGGALALVSYGYRQLRKRDGLGGGDIKMTAAMGTFLGPVGVLQALAIASMSGVLWVGGTMLVGRRRVTAVTRLKFGPFLALGGAIIALIRWHVP